MSNLVISNSFSPNTTILSAAVNTNFSDIATYINNRNGGSTAWDNVVSVAGITIQATTNQLILGTTNTTTITSPAPSASRTYTIPDSGGSANFVMSQPTFIGYGRNRVVNGAMRFDQRNEGSAYSSASVTQSLDCWKFFASGGGALSVVRSTSTPPTGFTHFQRWTATTADASVAAGDFYYAEHRIEGNRIRDFLFGTSSAATITLSFWVRSSLTGTFCVTLQNSTPNRSYITTYAINSADTWEQKSLTIAGDTSGTWLATTGVGISLIFDLGVGSDFENSADTWVAANDFRVAGTTRLISTLNATLDITGLQLEIGSTATAFEYLPDGIELGIVQRYLEKSYDIGTAIGSSTTTGENYIAVVGGSTSAGQYGAVQFKSNKRAAPTIVGYKASTGGTATWNIRDGSGSINVDCTFEADQISTTNFRVRGTSASGSPLTDGNPYELYGQWYATAEL